MFAAPQRLRRHGDVRRVYRRGQAIQTEHLRVHILFVNAPTPKFRATVVVPNKTLKSALARNRRKRQLRHAIRDLLSSTTTAADIVVVLTNAPSTVSFFDLRQQLHRVFVDKGMISGQGLSL